MCNHEPRSQSRGLLDEGRSSDGFVRYPVENVRAGAGGEGGIRTPDTVTRMPHFECGAFNHSATSPWPQRREHLFGGYVSNARPLNKGGQRRREAAFELRSQHRPIEIATNQYEFVPCLALDSILIQGKSLGHEMENVALVALGDPKHALAAVDVVRKPLEEILKSLHGKRPFALKRNGLETVRRQMIGGMSMAGTPLFALVI